MVPPTPERAEHAPPERRAPRLPRFKLPFVELPKRAPPSPGVLGDSQHVKIRSMHIFIYKSAGCARRACRASAAVHGAARAQGLHYQSMCWALKEVRRLLGLQAAL